MADTGNRAAERTLNILEKYDKALTTILIGNNIVNIACSSIATILAISLVGEKYGSLVSTIVTTVIVLIFGEVMPKSIAKDYPETIAMLASGVISFLMVIFTPFSALFILLKKGVSKLMHSSDKVSMTEEELKVMIDEIEDGILFLSNAGRPIFENNAFHSMLNLDPGLRQSPDLLNYLPEELTRQMAGPEAFDHKIIHIAATGQAFTLSKRLSLIHISEPTRH